MFLIAEGNVSALLPISLIGIYLHSVFVSITLGLPWVIGALLFKWWRSGEHDYYEAARTATGVLAVNFALGAITGTLVEFGLVQAWPGSIFVIATYGFALLSMELVAFIGEIVLLVLLIVTLGRVRPSASLGVLGGYLVMAILSGVLITSVNSWINVPWGTGDLAAKLYPFLPAYGPQSSDVAALVKLKVTLVNARLGVGASSQVLQSQPIALAVGVTLHDLFVALRSPYTLASVVHNVAAATIVGMAFALAGFAFRFFRTGDRRYVKFIRAFLPLLLVALILQPTVFGDMMGRVVAAFQPTKFALMENAVETQYNPVVALLAYGDPGRPIVGFDSFSQACSEMKGTKIGDLTSAVVPDFEAGDAGDIDVGELCLADITTAQQRAAIVNVLYYSKIAAGIIAFASIIAITSLMFNVRGISKLARMVLGRLGERKAALVLSLVVLLSSIGASMLGWYVREAGRKPWTVYGLIYPAEIVTPVPFSPIVVLLFTALFLVIGACGLYGMYVVAIRPIKFIELLRKGAGLGQG